MLVDLFMVEVYFFQHANLHSHSQRSILHTPQGVGNVVAYGMSSAVQRHVLDSIDSCCWPCCDWRQGLTLVHFSAHVKRFLWDRGCSEGLFRGCLGGVRAYWAGFRVYFVSETAQVELRSGRV
jgi:hypothetical protein